MDSSEAETVGVDQHRDWMDRIASGDEEAWAEVYEYYHQSLFRFCAGYVKSHAEVEDLVQEVFIRMKTRVHQYERGRSLRSWLYGISRNACLDHIKKKKLPRWREAYSSSWLNAEVAAQTTSPASKIVNLEEQQQLNASLEELSEEERTVVLLKHVEGLKRQEIAEILDIDTTKVKNLLYHALNALRKKVQKNL